MDLKLLIYLTADDSAAYLPNCEIAARNGSREIWIIPSNGRSISRIRKIAPDTEAAHSINVPTTTIFGFTNRLKLVNTIESQNTITANSGTETLLAICAASSQRVCAKSMPIFNA